MRKVELLAPAGSMEALKAAVENGCDAVYLGGKNFGARAFASNFDDEQIKEAIQYCHKYQVKIYITINTLMYEEEIYELIKYLDFLYLNGADAFIIQDLGVLELVRKLYPDIEIHASTQMHAHNEQATKLLQELGVKRIVLARETSLEKIKEIKTNTNADLEVFVYGALCVSYSGQCLMSSMLKKRSGNRGECAQLCRLNYELHENGKKIKTNGDYLLSLKDLNTLRYIDELIEAGIDSFKIEGRMKRPEYVALVVKFYRMAIDNYYAKKKNEYSKVQEKQLKTLFNRGFTAGHLFGQRGSDLVNTFRPNHLGIKIGKVIGFKNKRVVIKLSDTLNQEDGIRFIGNNDEGMIVNYIYKNGLLVSKALKGDIIELETKFYVSKDSDVLKTTDVEQIKELKKSFDKTQRKNKIIATLWAYENQPISLTFAYQDKKVTVKSKTLVQRAQNAPMSKKRIEEQIVKINDTIFEVEQIKIMADDNIFIRISELNELKREAAYLLEQELIKVNKRIINNYQKEALFSYCDKLKLRVCVKTKKQYQAAKDLGIQNILLDESLKDEIKGSYCYSKVQESSYKVFDGDLVNELGSLLQKKKVSTNYGLNVTNSYAVYLLNLLNVDLVTLSYELDLEQIQKLISSYQDKYLSRPNLEVICYSRIVLMTTKHCLINSEILDTKKKHCNLCLNNSYELVDNNGLKFKISTDKNCFNYIYNYEVTDKFENMADYLRLGIKSFRLDFTFESYDEAYRIIKKYQTYLNL